MKTMKTRVQMTGEMMAAVIEDSINAKQKWAKEEKVNEEDGNDDKQLESQLHSVMESGVVYKQSESELSPVMESGVNLEAVLNSELDVVLISMLCHESNKHCKGGHTSLRKKDNKINLYIAPTFDPPLIPDDNTQISHKYEWVHSLKDDTLLPFEPSPEFEQEFKHCFLSNSDQKHQYKHVKKDIFNNECDQITMIL